MKQSQTGSPSEFGDPKRDKVMRSISEDAPSKTGLFRRVFSGKASPRQAIKAQCLDCCGLSEEAIRDCASTQCPLWRFRPYQKSAKKGRSV